MAGWEKLKQTERDKMDQNASSQIFRSTRRNFFSIFVRKKKRGRSVRSNDKGKD